VVEVDAPHERGLHGVQGVSDVDERRRPTAAPADAPVLHVRDRTALGGEGVGDGAQVRPVVGGAPESAVQEHDQRRPSSGLREGEVHDLVGVGAIAQCLHTGTLRRQARHDVA
jgi:hypothetical protein